MLSISEAVGAVNQLLPLGANLLSKFKFYEDIPCCGCQNCAPRLPLSGPSCCSLAEDLPLNC